MSMTDENGGLDARIERIASREEFAQFVRELTDDFRLNRSAWENATLPDFLEALAAWVDALPGYCKNQGVPLPEPPQWRTFALILSAAKIYE